MTRKPYWMCIAAVMLLFLARPAGAAPTLSGSLGTAFGKISTDDGAGTAVDGLIQSIEANVFLRGDTGEAFTYYVRLRIRGWEYGAENDDSFADGQLQTVRVWLQWNATPALSLRMGRLAGLRGAQTTDKDLAQSPASRTTLLKGDDRGGLDVHYALGAGGVGMALFGEALEGMRLSGDNTGSNADSSNRVLAAYYNGAFGPLALHARYVSGSGASAGGSASSTGIGLAAEARTGPVKLAVDLETIANECVAAMGCTDGADEETNLIGFAVEAGGVVLFGEHSTVTIGATESAKKLLQVGYFFTLDSGKVGPELITQTETSGGVDETVDIVRLTYAVKF